MIRRPLKWKYLSVLMRRSGCSVSKKTAAFRSDFGRRAAWWTAPVLLILTGIIMTVWTWQTWADVTVDFGRELYVPWQLTEGKILYRDIAYFGGPLAPG